MITISDVAADKIKEILKAEGVPNHGLRVSAAAGGCCGPSYEIMIDDKAGDGDAVIEKNGAKLYVDASTAKTIDGAELGFVSDERGEGFVLGFPNGAPSVGSCGCGGEEPRQGSGGGCGSGGCGCS
ncbi:MAG TPA: iron-sulfur cluster assembly accessory protein [Nitrospirota bacterium]|nr:iron-sulfur cluster assembly accessory protein [Nitrospirota bacterium]